MTLPERFPGLLDLRFPRFSTSEHTTELFCAAADECVRAALFNCICFVPWKSRGAKDVKSLPPRPLRVNIKRSKKYYFAYSFARILTLYFRQPNIALSISLIRWSEKRTRESWLPTQLLKSAFHILKSSQTLYFTKTETITTGATGQIASKDIPLDASIMLLNKMLRQFEGWGRTPPFNTN